MPEPVFVIRNQHGLYLTRQNEWVDGHDAAPLFKAAYRDIALNTLIELNARDIELRGTILEVEVNDRGLPLVTPAEHVLVEETESSEAASAQQPVFEAEAIAEGGSESEAEQPGEEP